MLQRYKKNRTYANAQCDLCCITYGAEPRGKFCVKFYIYNCASNSFMQATNASALSSGNAL